MFEPPKTPEDCLRFIRCRITDDECELTCTLIEILMINARFEGKVEGIEQTTTRAIEQIGDFRFCGKGMV